MSIPERERVGSFVVTSERNLSSDGIICSQCQKLLSTYDAETDNLSPAPEALAQSGAVAIPNFGWFCSQTCAIAYEGAYDVRFQRNAENVISYYDENSE